MRKFLPFLLVGIIAMLPACCTSNNVKQQVDRATVVKQVVNKTTALVKYVNEKNEEVSSDDASSMLRAYCAATWVNENTMVTAEHCVENLGKPAISVVEAAVKQLLGIADDWDPTGQPLFFSMIDDVQDHRDGSMDRSSRPAHVLAIDKVHDLALVKADVDTMAPSGLPYHLVAAVAPNVSIGDDLHIVGHPMSMWWSYIRGTVSAVRPQEKGLHENIVNSLQVSAPVWLGNSGGGAFNVNGDLVGVCSWMKGQRNTIITSFFVDGYHVIDFLKANKISFVSR